MKREIIYANQFKKDMKLARRRHLPEEELIEIVTDLANIAKKQTENFIS